MHLIIGGGDRCIEESSVNKDLILVSTDKNKELLSKDTERSYGIKRLIEKVSNKLGKYGKHFMKIKFNSDNNLPINKILKVHNLTIIVGSVFQEEGQYYPQILLDEYLYES